MKVSSPSISWFILCFIKNVQRIHIFFYFVPLLSMILFVLIIVTSNINNDYLSSIFQNANIPVLILTF